MNKHLAPLITVLVLLAVTLALYVAWLYHVSTISESIRSTEAEIVLAKKTSVEGEKARATLIALSKNAEVIQKYFVDKESLVSFLEELGESGRRLGATLEILSVSDAKDGNGFPRINLAIKIEGSFDAVMRTVGVLEQGPYDSKVEQLTIEERKLDQAGAPWTATLTLSVGAHPNE